MYSKESIKKVVGLMDETIKKYSMIKDPDEIKICISAGNRKIGKVLNVSLPPIKTCANCSGCMWLCYDVKACLQYPNTVIDARVRNYVLMKNFRELFFSRIREKLSRRKKNKFFRWHVSGDIPDMEYFKNMIAIAKDFPGFVFWTYTKNYTLVNLYCAQYGKESIPENLSIMFSEWRGMAMENPYNFPVFSVVFKDDQIKPDPKKNHYCPGNCDICLKNGRGCPHRESTYCNEH